MSYKNRLTRNKADADRRARYRALGLCSCGRERMAGHARCEKCIMSARPSGRKYHKRRRPHLKKLGICVVCGTRRAMPQRTYCGVCAEADCDYHARKRKERKTS